jgi:hypothetical protein
VGRSQARSREERLKRKRPHSDVFAKHCHFSTTLDDGLAQAN